MHGWNCSEGCWSSTAAATTRAGSLRAGRQGLLRLLVGRGAPGRAAGGERQFDEAVALYRKTVARAPRPELAQALGDLFLFMGRAGEAKPWHDRALAGYLDSARHGEVNYYHHLARILCRRARRTAPRPLSGPAKTSELRPNFVTQDGLAWALYRDGQFAAALAVKRFSPPA